MRRALAASLMVVAVLTAACGNDSGDGEEQAAAEAPTAEEFCGVFEDFYAELQELSASGTPDEAKMIAAVRGVADDLDETGTPEDIPAEAQEGFDVTVAELQKLPEDATQQDLGALQQDFAQEQQDAAKAFDTYLGETCEDQSAEPSAPAEGESSGDGS